MKLEQKNILKFMFPSLLTQRLINHLVTDIDTLRKNRAAVQNTNVDRQVPEVLLSGCHDEV
jgi:hypothetical protein